MVSVQYIDETGNLHYRSYKWRELHDVQPLANAYAARRGWQVVSVIKLW